MMNKNKKYLIILLFILLFAFVSIGGVSAKDIDNTTITQADIVDDIDVVSVDEAVLVDNTLYENNNQTSVFLDSSQNTISDNDSSELSVSDDFVLKESYQVNSPIVNPSFDQDSSNLVGWDVDSAFVTNNFLYAKDGNRYVSISNQGFISQNVNLNTVDSVSFWYMSPNQGSKVEIWLDNNILKKYTIQNTGVGKNKWEQVNIDLSSYDGYHTLKLVQYGELAYIDYFNINYNQNLLANFSIESFSLVGDDLTISFRDKSYGVASSYLWDFGDGTTSTEQNPIHTFKLNHYAVTLTLSNGVSSSVYSLDLPVGFPTIERTSKEYFTIQEAISSAIDGDVINIPSDIFNCEFFENLVIDKSITLNFNNCTLKNKDNTNPLIQVNNNANVILNNISLTDNNVFISDDGSSLTIQNSSISNADLILNGNIIINENTLQNCYLIINNGNVVVSGSVFNGGSVIVNGGKSKIIGNVLSFCDIAIQQNGGQSNITDNIISNNDVGINITGGKSSVNFNAIYSNNHFGLVYKSNVDYANNWWATNNPTYTYGLETPSNYFDVYQNENINTGISSWLTLNLSQSPNISPEFILSAFRSNNKCYNISVDLTQNNLGEDFDINLSLKLDFIINNDYINSVVVQNGNGDLIFNWDDSLDEVNLTLFGENYLVPLTVDKTAPVITYITPSTTFDDEVYVEIKCDDPTALIIYTLDGTNPVYSNTSLIYTNPFIINESITVHYAVIDSAGNLAKIKDENSYKPYDVPVSILKKHVVLELKSFYTNKIYYTLDGSDPSNSSSRLIYNDFIVIDELTELRVSNGGVVYITCYWYDFSVSYLKNILNEDSNSIWSQYQGHNNHTGVSKFNGPLTNITKWDNLNIASSGSAVIDNEGHIYIGGNDGYLYCLNNQGLVIWKYGTSSMITSTPTIGSDGNIYFTNWMNSSLYCISPKGELIWKYYLGNYNTGSSPVFGYNNTLYVISGNDSFSNLFAFKDKKLLWTCKLFGITSSTPTIGNDGSIYLVSNNNNLVSVNIDGTIKFTSILDGSGNHVSVSIDDKDCVYVLNNAEYFLDNSVLAYYSNGTPIWSTLEVGVSGTPSYYEGVLYICSNSNLFALNSTNGKKLWVMPLNYYSDTLSSPLISANNIIYVSHGNMIYAFDLNGVQLWNYSLTGKYGGPVSFSSPSLSDDGTLIVTTNQGIYAFNDISADFTCSHVEGTIRTIQFTDLSTEGNNSYLWSFGDGFTSREQNPMHTYGTEGKYRVELLVEHDGINLVRNTTIEVTSYDISPPSDVNAYINGVRTKGGVFSETQTITLDSSDNSGIFTIYYTVDGSNPINSSTKREYIEAFDIEAYTIINAVAIDASNNIARISTFVFNITDAINVNDKINSTLIQKIQELLDHAEEGSKFVFDYNELYGANFTINKPLNIITTNNTRLVGNGIQPVFTLTDNAKGSSINGFIIENSGSEGILVKNSGDILIKDSIISAENSCGINIINVTTILVKNTYVDNSTNGIIVNKSSNVDLDRVNVKNSYDNGVYIIDCQNTNLFNSLLEYNGENPYFSMAHQILLCGSNNTNLSNNRINYGVFGIRLKNTNDNVTIDNNTVYEGIGDAILLEGRYLNINITHNDLDGSFIGIDFNGYSENVNVEHNLIHNMHEHVGNPADSAGDEYDAFYGFKHGTDLYGQYYNAIQVFEHASNFHEQVHIEDNIFIKVQHRTWEARKSGAYTQAGCNGYGYNLWDGSGSYYGSTTGAIRYTEGKVDLVLDRIGDSTYRLRLINRLSGEYLSEIPAFDVQFDAGSYSQTVQFVGNEAIATFDVASAITSVKATISSYISKTISWDIPITEGYSSSNKNHDSGYSAGEAIDNPNPKVPSIDEYIRSHQNSGNNGHGNGNGNGQGTGTGNGQGSGNGHGSSGHGGSNVNGREGEVEGDSNNLVRTNGGTSPSVGVQNAAEGDSDSVEGGSAAGESIEDSSNAYEVTKVINNLNENNLQFVLAVILLAIFIILGYGYRRGKKDGDEI